jgi:hypothetical protein
MRKLMMIAAVLGLFSGAAQAQGVATQNVNLTATVGGYCTIDGAATGTVRSATVPVGNGVVTPGNLTIGGSNGSVICTDNARIQLRTNSKGLTNSAAATGVFVNKIHYTATADYNGATATINTETATAGVDTTAVLTTGGAQTNQPLTLAITITATPIGKYLVNGSYADTLVVTLSPQP